jgi:hypothetical protein
MLTTEKLIIGLGVLIEQLHELNFRKKSVVDLLVETRLELLRLRNIEEEAKYFKELCEAYEKNVRWRFDDE